MKLNKHFRFCLLGFFILALTPVFGQAKIVTKTVEYKADQTLKGFLAYDDEIKGPRPGILVVHEWWGHNDYARKRALQLAKMGYVALAVDMYGDGKSTQHPDQAKEWMQEAMKNFDGAMGRFLAAQKLLKEHELTNPNQIAAIGYCFGGGVVLNSARLGHDLKAVVSFHGSLGSPIKTKKDVVKAKVLVFHGASDDFIPEDQVTAFKKEMKEAGADLQFISYPDVEHSFTNPGADKMAKKFKLPLKYDAKADKDSWQKMEKFFKELF